MLKKPLNGIVIILIGILVASCATSKGVKVPKRQPVIALLTDFGAKDHYEAAMKGAIYSVNPRARIDHITNQITKFDIAEGAYTLAMASKEYPNGTIFVAVVDPGVGSDRKSIVIKSNNGKLFVGPDNGLMVPAAKGAGIAEVREITNRALMRPGDISSTFHARDVFGPVAGNLAAGASFESVGPIVSDIVELPQQEAVAGEGRAVGRVLHADEYGNLITNIPISDVETIGLKIGSTARLRIGEKDIIAKYVHTYSDVETGAPLFLNNRGFVEAAINRGNLAREVDAANGSSVVIER